jgi:hypothetical protein
LVVQSLSSRTILLKPLSATLVGNGSGGKENESECNDDGLEVKGRHLSKMLESEDGDKRVGNRRANERIGNERYASALYWSQGMP